MDFGPLPSTLALKTGIDPGEYTFFSSLIFLINHVIKIGNVLDFLCLLLLLQWAHGDTLAMLIRKNTGSQNQATGWSQNPKSLLKLVALL